MVPLFTVSVVRVDTRSSAINSHEDHDVGDVLVDIAKSHQESRVRTGLPSAEVGDEASDSERETE